MANEKKSDSTSTKKAPATERVPLAEMLKILDADPAKYPGGKAQFAMDIVDLNKNLQTRVKFANKKAQRLQDASQKCQDILNKLLA